MLCRVRHAVTVLKEVIYLCNFKRVSYTLVHARKDQRVPFLLMPDISANQGPDPGRVNVGHAGEINHQCISSTGADQVLKFIERANRQWSRELQDAFLIL